MSRPKADRETLRPLVEMAVRAGISSIRGGDDVLRTPNPNVLVTMLTNEVLDEWDRAALDEQP